MTALNGDVMTTGTGLGEGDNNDNEAPTSEDNSNGAEEVDIDVDNGIEMKNTKVKKVSIHDAAAVNILKKGVEK